MYRSFAQFIIKNSIDHKNKNKVIELANSFEYDPFAKKQTSEDIAAVASVLSTIPEVRECFNKWQYNFAKNGAVLDGRDIGSVVLKDAKYKFYITADIDVRAQRRYNELREEGVDCNLSSIKEYLEARDMRDKDRASAPLVIAKNAFVIDTSHLSSEDVFLLAINHIKKGD